MASANVLRTIFTYAVTGLGPYTIAFDYLARKFVQVTLIGPDRKLLVLNTDYRFTSTKAITLLKAAPAGYTQIEIRRYTDASDRLVDFQDGSILRATDLNVSQVQTMHIAEEGRDVASNTLGVDADGNLDARGRKIVNLVDGVFDGDAVTIRQMKSYNDSAFNSKNAAATSAAAALLSEQHAKTSETNSKTSETNSGNSASLSQKWAANPAGTLVDATRYSSLHYSVQAEQSSQAAQVAATTATQQAQAASGSASSASGSATAATQSALTANQQADRAKTEADKLANFNAFGAALSGDATNGFRVAAQWGVTGLRLADPGNSGAWLWSVDAANGSLKLNAGAVTLNVVNINGSGITNIGPGSTFSSTTAARNFAGAMGQTNNGNNRLLIPTATNTMGVFAFATTVTANSFGDANVSFPQAFANANPIVSLSNGNESALGGTISQTSVTATGFGIRCKNYDGTVHPGLIQVNYIVMGVVS